jgi:hypothetical protein
MPVGMMTVEFIPNSLQEEWTKAWNDVNRMRDGAETDEIRDRALKWILWLPHGLLHATNRGGKKGARQFRDLARRFVMWRQRDMTGLMKAWRQAAITAEKRMEKARARKEKGDRARVSRAIRLIRRGAISRAGKALESKGLGDLTDGSIWDQIKAKHPERKRQIPERAWTFVPEEELRVKVDTILPKLDVYAAPGPGGLRNAHIRIWTGVFAPETADEAVEHLETIVSDMANDKMPGWFMQATQAAEVIALIKGEKEAAVKAADHRPVQVPNTLAKVGDKAVLMIFQKDYIQEMLPQQLGVGVKYAAELLVMGLRMTLHRNDDFIILGVDISNAYCELMRASVVERHMESEKMRGMVPYWRAKLGPNAKLWAGADYMDYMEGLVQGSPTSSSGFSFTIHDKVKEADRRLAEVGGCARFGMDDGYMVGPKEIIFDVLAKFAEGIERDHGCALNTRKCKMYSRTEGACEEARREGFIPAVLEHIQEGTYVNETGDIFRGILIFNVPVGEERYVEAVLRDKAQQVGQVTRQYVEDLEEEYPQELWTMLQFSLQHRITYWLRTCTPEETRQMAEHVDYCIMEAVQAATGVDFDGEEAARERLRIPARMKGGGIRRATETRYPAFLGALLDVLPRCIDRTEDNGESIKGYYTQQLVETIGEGAYDSEGHRNERFLLATDVGPYPEECMKAWTVAREEAMENLGMRDDPEQEGWEKMGPLADPTPANAKNRGAADRKSRRREERGRESGEVNGQQTQTDPRAQGEGINEGETDGSEMEGIREAVAEAIQEEEREYQQRTNREQEEDGQEGTAAGRHTEGRGEGRGQRQQSQQQKSGQNLLQEHQDTEMAQARPTTNTGTGERDQNQVQRLRQRLMDRFGAENVRPPEQAERRQERILGQSLLQEESPSTSTSRQETPEERYRRMGKAPMPPATPAIPTSVGRDNPLRTPPTTRYAGEKQRFMKSPLGRQPAARTDGGRRGTAQANTPWRLWTAAEGAAKEVQTSQATITATLDETRRAKIDRDMRGRDQTDFGRKAWMQADKMSSAWVTACPKEHSALNARQFPVVVQTYFGVGQSCLVGLVGQKIRQKAGRGMSIRETECDAYGENLVKATLPGAGWTLHHDAINLQIHRVARQSGMVSTMEVEEYFLRRLQESAINPDSAMPLLGKQLRGYVPDGRQTGIASSKRPAGVDQFTEVKVIHSGAVQYRRPDVRDNPRGSAAVNKFQGQVRQMYLGNLHKKDQTHFATAEGAVGPLEAIFRTLDFKPLVFGTFAEASSNVSEFVELAVEYGVEHSGRNMAATSVEAVRAALRRRYKTQIATAAWRGYANLMLDRTKYVGTGAAGINKAQVRQVMIDRADEGEFVGMYMAHETDEPTRDAFPSGWGDIGGDALD